MSKNINFFNRGYCKFKESCPLFHPKEICIEEKCLNQECKKRHPNKCKLWEKGLCKFGDLCEFTHPKKIEIHSEISNQDIVLVNNLIEEANTEAIDTYVDYDNIDSDDDIDENIFSCNQCEHTSVNKSSLTKHVKLVHKKDEEKLLKRKRDSNSSSSSKKTKEEEYSCDDCVFTTKDKKSLKEHKDNSCEEKLD